MKKIFVRILKYHFPRKLAEVILSEEGIVPLFLSLFFGLVIGITIIPIGLVEGWFWLVVKITMPLVFCEGMVYFYIPRKQDIKSISAVVRDCYIAGVVMGIFLYLLYALFQQKF